MTYGKIEEILASNLSHEPSQLDSPSPEDWHRVERKFGCRFEDDFKHFIGLMSRYQFPGEILNVSSGRTNGNDSIELTFDFETNEASWNLNMIPFFAIGNGDYFCLNKLECPASPVYYFYSERNLYEMYCHIFEDWIKRLPEFLAR